MERGRSSGLGGVLGIALGALAIGFVVAAADPHAHTCDQCGRRWWHLGAFNRGNEPAHTCRCGEMQWWKDSVPHERRVIADHADARGRWGAMHAARVG